MSIDYRIDRNGCSVSVHTQTQPELVPKGHVVNPKDGDADREPVIYLEWREMDLHEGDHKTQCRNVIVFTTREGLDTLRDTIDAMIDAHDNPPQQED